MFYVRIGGALMAPFFLWVVYWGFSVVLLCDLGMEDV